MVHIQKSFDSDDAKLFIVPTPIGNLDDMTFRAVKTLENVELIACEDTRQTKKLLSHFNIEKPLLSYHEHNKYNREEGLVDRLKQGQSIALVSDAGMPIISDPGFEIVRRSREEGIDVTVLPGANAALTALVGSGIDSRTFTFYGFLPRKKKEMVDVLETLGRTNHTLIFYESPYRIKQTLKVMHEAYSPTRQISVARELTKKFEEYVYGTLDEVTLYMQSESAELRGEFCIVLEGQKEFDDEEEQWWDKLALNEHVDYYIEKGYSTKDAIKVVAKDRSLPKREVYQDYHR
ncbi:16S rRNA (cytidine(1402)-2'-O)-methyltransferase [Tenuibacillus multivorans]|uniref:Ribosomal RNA small subunit methyltransferase I n=1 Tax=Tenuibacillus multivorans TaxID=237069 RepID=A0A1G9W1Z5_9BACI|nr:16S rRNA (cytidine(1402)-2'-O)-methyltransferase [Tenuibacillus multivorans]GEL78274.1 ribosomal RNA small subunit methyltransferase I [Tenuibacillus multivorans]SDM78211.1 16S rRNA (cytidine1402-2'-O)-methyltransferase [Tenuibacillus multivorans]